MPYPLNYTRKKFSCCTQKDCLLSWSHFFLSESLSHLSQVFYFRKNHVSLNKGGYQWSNFCKSHFVHPKFQTEDIHSVRTQKYLHAINPPWQPAALLRVPTHISTSLSQLNSSATPPPFLPQTNVPWAWEKQYNFFWSN